jgi:hypothetical protein
MNQIAMSPVAAALLRGLIARAGVPRDRILLSDAQSVDWRSLTFTGERPLFELRVPGPDSVAVVERMCEGLEHAEFSIPGTIVADIGIATPPSPGPDGATSIAIEALTVVAD